MKCVCSIPHSNLHGVPLLMAQNYEKPLARLLAKVILNDIYDANEAYVTEEVEPNQDDAERQELHAELRSSFDAGVIKSVTRVHQQLGHPTPGRSLAIIHNTKWTSSCTRRALKMRSRP